MIPKQFVEITWDDLVALQQSGREEDDTIEFKEGFSGGIDFEALSEQQRNNAVDGIAKEAIAFLNSRGGDILIGAKERRNDHPVIEELIKLKNVHPIVDRLGQALSATIEPRQNLLSVRAITEGDEADGAVVIRVPSSLRAPHRSTRKRECYVRRGRESVPMSMDEIQDLTLSRSTMRSEQLEELKSLALEVQLDEVGRAKLREQRAHVRLVFVPFNKQAVLLSPEVLGAFKGTTPTLQSQNYKTKNDVGYRGLHGLWKPILRGMRNSEHTRGDDREMYYAKELHESGVFLADFSVVAAFGNIPDGDRVIHYEWIVGFIANALLGIRSATRAAGMPTQGFLTLGYRFDVQTWLSFGEGFSSEAHKLPHNNGIIPPFEIYGDEQFEEVFCQLQTDICALVGENEEYPFIWTSE